MPGGFALGIFGEFPDAAAMLAVFVGERFFFETVGVGLEFAVGPEVILLAFGQP